MMTAKGKAALILASQATSAVIAYGSLLVTGRFFDPAAYGMVAVSFGIGNLLAIFTDMGLGYAHQRKVAMGLDRNVALGSLARTRLTLVAGVALVVAAGLLVAGPRIFAIFSDSTTPAVIFAGFLYQVLSILRGLPESTWSAEQKVHLVEGLRLTESLTALFMLSQAGLVIAALNGTHPPLLGIGQAWVNVLGLQGPLDVPHAALLLMSAYLVGRTTTLLLAFAWMRSQGLHLTAYDGSAVRDYVKMALPLSLASVIGIVLVSTDTIFLGAFWNASEAAYYGAAQRLGGMVALLGGGVSALLFPRFAQLHAEGDREAQDATFIAAQRFLLLLWAPLAAALIAMPEKAILLTVGPAYLAAVPSVQAMGAWGLCMVLGQPLLSRLMGEGNSRVLVLLTALNAGANVALLAVLVPPGALGLGAFGASLSTFLATLLGYAGLRAWTRRHHGTPLWQAHMGRILFCAALTGAAWYAIVHYLPSQVTDQAWKVIAAGLLGLAAYGGLLIALREIGPDDWGPPMRALRHATATRRARAKE